jgi:DoxX-like family
MDANLPRWFQLFMGVAEAAAAIGLILPGRTRVMPFLVSWAAVGIAIIMMSATGSRLGG